MPIYPYECPQCGASEDMYTTVENRNIPHGCRCGAVMNRVIARAYAVADLAPYTAVAGDMAGKPIEGRKAHREFLKRNRFHEIGNEPVRPIRNNFKPSPGAVREELRRVVPEVLRKSR